MMCSNCGQNKAMYCAKCHNAAGQDGSEVELMLWLASNMDCLSMCCICCEDKRKELMAYFEKHGVADSHLLEDLRKAVPNEKDDLQERRMNDDM